MVGLKANFIMDLLLLVVTIKKNKAPGSLCSDLHQLALLLQICIATDNVKQD